MAMIAGMAYAQPRSYSMGKRIRKRRQVLGMTQQDLADRLGVAKSTVSNWESGKHFPLRYLGAVEHVLGISLEGEQPPPVISPQLRRMVGALTEEERNWLLAELAKVSEPPEDPDDQQREEAC
jgi:transcriptional regulator with XRE-family HTH domain